MPAIGLNVQFEAEELRWPWFERFGSCYPTEGTLRLNQASYIRFYQFRCDYCAQIVVSAPFVDLGLDVANGPVDEVLPPCQFVDMPDWWPELGCW